MDLKSGVRKIGAEPLVSLETLAPSLKPTLDKIAENKELHKELRDLHKELQKDVGASISEQVLNSLGLLAQELRPDVIGLPVLQPNKDTNIKYYFAPDSASARPIDAALGKSSDLDIYGVKIPLGFIAVPIQAPMRSLLGIHTITGTLHDAGSDGLMLLASSTEGPNWRVSSKAGAVAGQMNNKSSRSKATSHNPRNDLVERMADQLAFDIITTRESLMSSGLTRSREAYKFFQSGFEKWKCYLETKRYDSLRQFSCLQEAIAAFREAVEQDPNFGFANYRLGLALIEDGQPSAAVNALSGSIQSNSQFVAAYNSLGFTLYRFDSYHGGVPAALDPLPTTSEHTLKSRRQHARQLWLHVLTLPTDKTSYLDRGTAYSGLCQYTWDLESNALQSLSQAYYYCKRAERLYTKVLVSQANEEQVKDNIVNVLNTLGVIVGTTPQGGTPTFVGLPHGEKWTCQAVGTSVELSDDKDEELIVAAVRSLPLPYSRSAIRYFERALAHLPTEPTVRCNAASTALAMGRTALMRSLQADPFAHVFRAEYFYSEARSSKDNDEADKFISLALSEHQEAIDRDPDNYPAANGFAYTFWLWQLRWPSHNIPKWDRFETALKAERYIRRALEKSSAQSTSIVAIQLRSTLGEVLLAQARSHEAVEELEKAKTRLNQVWAEGMQHPAVNELLWDLGTAYICAAFNEKDDGISDVHSASLEKKATALFEQVRLNETKREIRPFSDRSDLIDPATYRPVCRRQSRIQARTIPENTPSATELRFKRVNFKYRRYPVCDRMALAVDVGHLRNDLSLLLRVHVWGGGVDQTTTGDQEHIYLNAGPRTTRSYYFVQLEDGNGKPLSQVKTFNTHNDCSRNLISVTFSKI